MTDETQFRITADESGQTNGKAPHSVDSEAHPDASPERLKDMEKRMALFEELLFDCAMTLKDKVADRLDQLESLCHQETAQLRQEFQQEGKDRRQELNLLTLKISEAIDRIAAQKNRQLEPGKEPAREKGDRFPLLDNIPPKARSNRN